MAFMNQVILKPGREKSLLRRHPWIFSGAVANINGTPKSGETVTILSNNGQFLAKAAYSPNSQIIGRVWTWDENETVGADFFYEKLKQAIEIRRRLIDPFQINACRVVHGESDGLPGLILDQYDDLYVVQFLTTGTELWRKIIADIINTLTHAKAIYERSDSDVRQLEGLDTRVGILSGKLSEQPVIISEYGLKYYINIINGHKTGFYIDQRENRRLIRNFTCDFKVLDCFSYTGGFAINALAGGASSVVIVDTSDIALSVARKNIELNGLDLTNAKFIMQDVFTLLRELRDRGDKFDMVILDPPKFAPTSAQIERAARGYKDINLLAFKLLRPGGYLVTFSCSGGINEDLFQKIVAGAALDAGADALILDRLHQGIDHPVSLNFPEGAYLKGFIIQKRN
jgi:23S rRNA (cytosine1962-C5)-methyltransferase